MWRKLLNTVLSCAKYKQSRTDFIQKLNRLHIDFDSMQVTDKMNFLLNVDSGAINEICCFFSEICKSRNLV